MSYARAYQFLVGIMDSLSKKGEICMLETAKERLNASFGYGTTDGAMLKTLQSIAASLIGILEHLEEKPKNRVAKRGVKNEENS